MEASCSTETLVSIYQTTQRLFYCRKISTLNMEPAGISELFAFTYIASSNIRRISVLNMEQVSPSKRWYLYTVTCTSDYGRDWTSNSIYRTLTHRNYNTLIHTLCSSLENALGLLSLLYLHRLSPGNGFQRRSFLDFRVHVLTGRRLFHK
jgi:hypothetical protein